jgi:hypothetical protein
MAAFWFLMLMVVTFPSPPGEAILSTPSLPEEPWAVSTLSAPENELAPLNTSVPEPLLVKPFVPSSSAAIVAVF